MSQKRRFGLPFSCIEKNMFEHIEVDIIITDFSSRNADRKCFTWILKDCYPTFYLFFSFDICISSYFHHHVSLKTLIWFVIFEREVRDLIFNQVPSPPKHMMSLERTILKDDPPLEMLYWYYPTLYIAKKNNNNFRKNLLYLI